MSNSKPIGCSSLKCLLKNLDPGLRLRLSTACPSIQHIEKSVPMDIKYLQITDNSVTVNRTTYQLSVINSTKSYPYDINQYGWRDLSEIEPDPTEIRIDNRKDPSMELVKRREERMAQLKVEASAGDEHYEEIIKNLDMLQKEHDEMFEELWNYAPSEHYIQLTIGRSVERLKYQRKMHEAMKYLLWKLFGERKSENLNVCRFSVTCENILRCPVKFRIQFLELLDKTSLEPARLLIEGSSLPLSLVKFRHFTFPDADDPVIQTARILHVQPTKEVSIFELLNLECLKQQRVHVTYPYRYFKTVLELIVDGWIFDGKEIGTYFTFELSENKIDEIMREVRRIYYSSSIGEFTWNCDKITMQMNDTSNLIISKIEQGNKWILGLKVEHRRVF